MMSKPTAIAAALIAAASIGLAASPALADTPRVGAQDVRAMDTNKDGRVSKQEFLAAMGSHFDKAAGAKGYCTYQEVTEGLKAVQEWYKYSN